jgi:hypothetical protein
MMLCAAKPETQRVAHSEAGERILESYVLADDGLSALDRSGR